MNGFDFFAKAWQESVEVDFDMLSELFDDGGNSLLALDVDIETFMVVAMSVVVLAVDAVFLYL